MQDGFIEQKISHLLSESQKFLEQARSKKDYDALAQAERLINQILLFNCSHKSGLFLLGCIYMIRDLEGIAETCFLLVWNSDKDYINAANNLGIIYKNKEEREKAVSLYLEVLDKMEKKGETLFPDKAQRDDLLADIYANIGSCLTNNGTPDEALEYYEKALKLKDLKDRNTPRFNMALSYLEKNDFKNGFDNYWYYSVVHPDRRVKNYHTPDNPTPKWQGDKSQVVAILGEQGLGDELMFASMIPDICKDMKIVFDSHPRLQNLFRNAWPDLPIYGTRKDMQSTWNKAIQPDAFIPISEIAKYYRQKESDFSGESYLDADENLFKLLPPKLRKKSDRLKIGFSWTGGLIKTNLYHRTIPFEQLERLLRLDCDFYSLQYKNEHNQQLLKYCKEKGINSVTVYQNILDDYDLTACMLEHLDMIFCAPQSVIFLAGALGVETYQLCPKRGMWQQGKYGEDMVWFKSVHNIWQPEPNDWKSVIDESIKVINEHINQ